MSERAIRLMTADEFLEWDLLQEERHELIDGVPVAMTGAKQRHDRVVVNALATLSVGLRGRTCVPFTDDVAIRVPNGNVRRPDIGLHCEPFDDDAIFSARPRLVIEVLSRSTDAFDRVMKLEEYKTVPSLEYILLASPEAADVMLWSRDEGDWRSRRLFGLDAVIEFPKLDVALPLADLYAGVRFPRRPRLVWDEPS